MPVHFSFIGIRPLADCTRHFSFYYSNRSLEGAYPRSFFFLVRTGPCQGCLRHFIFLFGQVLGGAAYAISLFLFEEVLTGVRAYAIFILFYSGKSRQGCLRHSPFFLFGQVLAELPTPFHYFHSDWSLTGRIESNRLPHPNQS